eukprot:7131538-Prymnesium_polylepis.1
MERTPMLTYVRTGVDGYPVPSAEGALESSPAVGGVSNVDARSRRAAGRSSSSTDSMSEASA